MDVEKTIQFLLQNQAKHDGQIGQILEIANKLENIVAGLVEHARRRAQAARRARKRLAFPMSSSG